MALVPDYTPMDGGAVKGQEFSSVQDGIKALGKAHDMRSGTSLRSFPNAALQTVPMFV